MTSEESTGSDSASDPVAGHSGRPDTLRRVVHVALVLYLSPVILLVAAIGVSAIVIDRLIRAMASWIPVKGPSISRLATIPVPSLGTRPTLRVDHRRSRATR